MRLLSAKLHTKFASAPIMIAWLSSSTWCFGSVAVLLTLTWFPASTGFKVGVVGRTGAGKSSLIGALFRLTEIDAGCITVDHTNTKVLGLKQLRSAMALIPQVRKICLEMQARRGGVGGRIIFLISGPHQH
jgi:ABC-type transport system involved in Fe-S cluster assembly fused permease/ATPase subunit